MQTNFIGPMAFYDERDGTYKIADGGPVAWTLPSESGEVGISRLHRLLVFVAKNTIAYTNTANKTLFTLPANAVILDVLVHVTTAFNSSGTDVIGVGTTVGAPNEHVNAQDVSAVGIFRAGASAAMPHTALGSVGAAAITVLGKFTQSIADAATGEAVVEIIFALA
jgi:hypothetical protein